MDLWSPCSRERDFFTCQFLSFSFVSHFTMLYHSRYTWSPWEFSWDSHHEQQKNTFSQLLDIFLHLDSTGLPLLNRVVPSYHFLDTLFPLTHMFPGLCSPSPYKSLDFYKVIFLLYVLFRHLYCFSITFQKLRYDFSTVKKKPFTIGFLSKILAQDSV